MKTETKFNNMLQDAIKTETDPEVIHTARQIVNRIAYKFGYSALVNKLVGMTDAFSNKNSRWRFLLNKELTCVTIQDRCSILHIYREIMFPFPKKGVKL